jgi:hypothetical protein
MADYGSDGERSQVTLTKISFEPETMFCLDNNRSANNP